MRWRDFRFLSVCSIMWPHELDKQQPLIQYNTGMYFCKSSLVALVVLHLGQWFPIPTLFCLWLPNVKQHLRVARVQVMKSSVKEWFSLFQIGSFESFKRSEEVKHSIGLLSISPKNKQHFGAAEFIFFFIFPPWVIILGPPCGIPNSCLGTTDFKCLSTGRAVLQRSHQCDSVLMLLQNPGQATSIDWMPFCGLQHQQCKCHGA